ncbi:MAG: ABC transporter ATP-binding protein [Acidimicrobiales bacterium]
MLAHRLTLVSALAASFVGLVVQVQIPNLLNQAVTNSIQRHVAPLSHYASEIAVLAVVSGLANAVARLNLMRTAYGIEYDLRHIIYEHLTRMSFSFYDRVQSGQLISRANSDIRSVNMYLTFAPAILVQCAIAVVAFGYMLLIDVPLALVAMVTMPFIYVVGTRMRKSMFPVSWLIQSRLAEVATVVDENVSGVRIVKAFATEPRELSELARAATRLRWSYVKDADLRARFAPAVQNLPQVGLALVVLLGGYLVIQGRLGVGAILAFSAYIVMLQAPFQMLGMLIMMGQRAAASAGRIYQIVDEQPTVVDRPGAVDLVGCRGEVTFDDVWFSYGRDGAHAQEDSPVQDESAVRDESPEQDRSPVLVGVDLALHPGETVAIVGRTGSGKSTMARLLARFYDVSAGAVRVDGVDVRDLTLASLRHNVGIVLDEPFLFSASVRDNIAYGVPDADLVDVRAAARAAGAEDFIEELPQGYDTVVGERGYTLSGGQRQRIAIARTLLVGPAILVLDDATSAIDVEVEHGILHELRRLRHGRTTLLVAHRLSTIALADRVVLVDGGRVVADGTHAELLERVPLYSEVLAQVGDLSGQEVPGSRGAGEQV